VDPTKIETVVKWERPKTVTKVRSFLGLAGYQEVCRRVLKEGESIDTSYKERSTILLD